MNIYVAVTDDNWYNFLAESRPDEVNLIAIYWQIALKTMKRREMFGK